MSALKKGQGSRLKARQNNFQKKPWQIPMKELKEFKQEPEGKALVLIPREKKVSKKLPVFYNPAMEINRTISVILLNSVKNKNMQIAMPLAGTGVRGARLILELKKGKIKNISFNDSSERAAQIIKENLKLNKIKLDKNKITITNKDANIFLLESSGFDYVDIDPFGTPNYFLDSAVKRLARGGILAVTATDTSCLAGSFPDACRRKYWASSLRGEMMHEAGLRILIRKVQLIGSQFEKALTPIFSYSDQHYMRVFFSCEKGKHKADKILDRHGILNHNGQDAGPMWLGQLWDKSLAEKMAKLGGKDDCCGKILGIIAEEAKIGAVGFYDIHRICKRNKISKIPKMDYIISRIKQKKHKAALTHFSPTGIRSDISEKEIEKIIKGK